MGLENEDGLLTAKEDLKHTEAELEPLQAKLEQIRMLDDEFSLTVKKELKSQIREKMILKVNLENELLTNYNTDIFVQKIKNLIKPFKKIETLEEFPFKELFSKIIVENRGCLILIIGKRQDFENIDLNQSGILHGEIDYLIRKTTFTTCHKVLFY